ncbi:MAG: hypothetical protein ORN26_00090 [Candidatus Pacebacteria bacterium]|nr:hypothetical protein [Candidatus Paceibacterota bacterium]
MDNIRGENTTQTTRTATLTIIIIIATINVIITHIINMIAIIVAPHTSQLEPAASETDLAILSV